MILYVNGCSHTAAAEAVVPNCFAVDDGKAGIDRRPHPKNLAASWCTKLAEKLKADLICHAESASGNDRIIRTTKNWIESNPTKLNDTFVILQWTTWEREEWLHENTYYQVNASGWDWVPAELRDRYKQFVVSVNWTEKTQEAHEKIWNMHGYLAQQNVKHLFYSSFSTFSNITNQHNWGTNYIAPYDQMGSYNAVLLNNGFQYVNPKSYHFGANGHSFWSEHVLQYLKHHQLLDHFNEISTD